MEEEKKIDTETSIQNIKSNHNKEWERKEAKYKIKFLKTKLEFRKE